jgi:hypothetical protein
VKSLVATILYGLALTAAAAERPDDFAYASPLESDGTLPLRRVDLPAWLYQGVFRADLGDVRVFNGDGELVPHALLPRPAPTTSTAPETSLPYFPIKAAAGSALDTLDVKIERTPGGTITRVVAARPGKNANQVMSAYLVDASRFEQPIAALDLDVREPHDGFTGSVRVESSDDLAHWSTLVPQAPVVMLQFAGQRLERKQVEFSAARCKYLRLSWPMGQPPLDLIAVRARPGSVIVEPPRAWHAVTATPARQGEFEFDLGGQFPLDRLRVELPQDNTVVLAQLLSTRDPTGEWHPVTSAVLYRLRQGDQTVTNPDLATSISHDRYWLLRVDQKGGGIGRGTVTLHAGWVPQTLVFVARGNGPFQLAYGSARALPTAFPIESLVPGFRSDLPLQASTARALEQRTLKGAAALRPARDVRAWTLWGVLILGVLLLAWMAWRLARQLASTTSAR